VQTETDARSRAETSRLTDLSERAGFQAPAVAALARGSAAQARQQLGALAAQCELSVKALVALTAIPSPSCAPAWPPTSPCCRSRRSSTCRPCRPRRSPQRPDLYLAARDLVAASAGVSEPRRSACRASRSSARSRPRASRPAASPATARCGRSARWRSACRCSTAAPGAPTSTPHARRYDETAVAYRATLRGAVREVEEALVLLASTATRVDDARIAVENFDAAYTATDARFRGGLASVFELEDARRSAVVAQIQYVDLQRDRVAAWIQLYRALGGGWSPRRVRRHAHHGRDRPPPPVNPAHRFATMKLQRTPLALAIAALALGSALIAVAVQAADKEAPAAAHGTAARRSP
jgi:hypothetical protein